MMLGCGGKGFTLSASLDNANSYALRNEVEPPLSLVADIKPINLKSDRIL